jgi:hypothetical protein
MYKVGGEKYVQARDVLYYFYALITKTYAWPYRR